MLPEQIKKVIKKYEKRIYNDIPIDEIFTDLKADEVISEDEVSLIMKHNGHKGKNYELIKILKTRDISDYFKLCTTLKNQDIKNAQELGTMLENEANKALLSGNIINDTNVQGKVSLILVTTD